MKLWPNLGGEEGGVSPALRRGHPLREVGHAWTLLFGRDVQLLSCEPDGEEVRHWPAALGEEPDGPVWDWLELEASAVAWWPDAEARREVERQALCLNAPSDSTLRAVHDKAFPLAHLREQGGADPELCELLTAFDPEELRDTSAIKDVLRAWPDWARARWVLKPRFGSSGRGRVHSAELVDEERFRRALPRLIERGGAILEPWLEREGDYSVELVIHADGSVESLGSVRQFVRAGGGALGCEFVLDSQGGCKGADEHHDELVAAALSLGAAAAARGFRGPCGVDSFSWRDGSGALRMRALCELNARFTTSHVAIGCALRLRAKALDLSPARVRFRLAGGEGLSLAAAGGPSLEWDGA